MAKDMDIRKKQCSIDEGTDVKNTQMLKGKGKFSSAQNETNVTTPYNTGSAPPSGGLGGKSTY